METAFANTLSAEETERGRRFVNATLRRRFNLSHGILRQLLSQYLSVPPQDIVFGEGSAGKPFLKNDGAQIQFNMSHSDDMAVYAFSRRSHLGIDIERVRLIPELESVAKLSFTRRECTELESLQGSARVESFFRCWTRKEAYVKAVGQGLSLPFNSFEVGSLPGQSPTVHRVHAGELHEDWQICDITPPDHIGAVVIEGGGHDLSQQVFCSVEELVSFLSSPSAPSKSPG